jgi:hypothetical protein
MSEEFTNVLVRMGLEQKAALQREAAVYGRSLTAEINLRLQASLRERLPDTYDAPALVTTHSTAHTTNQGNQTVNIAQEKSPADPLTETDRAMLAIFRRMPVEKQLALLSLFK